MHNTTQSHSEELKEFRDFSFEMSSTEAHPFAHWKIQEPKLSGNLMDLSFVKHIDIISGPPELQNL